jgi:ABC-type multidrug transport system permease subunit
MKSSLLLHPLIQLFMTRFREFIRTPEAVFWSYVFPLVMMIALGLAFRSEPVRAVAVTIQQGTGAADAEAALKKDPMFLISKGTEAECRQRLRSGKTELVVTAVQNGEALSWKFLYSVNDALQRAAGRVDLVTTEDVTVIEPGSRYIDFLVPGLIGMGLLGGGIWGVGYAIVDMRIRQVLKRFLGTPMKKHHFVAAMMASRIVFMIPEIIVILILAKVMFGVTSHGGYVSIAAIVILGAMEFASIGLLIASRARTLEAVAGLMNLAMVPMWIGSGIFFSSERFPEIVQPVIRILPLTPVIASLRQVMQEGAGVLQIAPDLGLMFVWAVGTFLIALRIFRWD